MAGGDKLCENLNSLQGLTFDGHGETGIYILEAELKIDASQNVKGMRMFGPNLAACQLQPLS